MKSLTNERCVKNGGRKGHKPVGVRDERTRTSSKGNSFKGWFREKRGLLAPGVKKKRNEDQGKKRGGGETVQKVGESRLRSTQGRKGEGEGGTHGSRKKLLVKCLKKKSENKADQKPIHALFKTEFQ